MLFNDGKGKLHFKYFGHKSVKIKLKPGYEWVNESHIIDKTFNCKLEARSNQNH